MCVCVDTCSFATSQTMMARLVARGRTTASRNALHDGCRSIPLGHTESAPPPPPTPTPAGPPSTLEGPLVLPLPLSEACVRVGAGVVGGVG